MIAQRIKPRCKSNDARAATQHVRDNEEAAADFSEHGATNYVRHVGDGVALRVAVAEVALNYGEVWGRLGAILGQMGGEGRGHTSV